MREIARHCVGKSCPALSSAVGLMLLTGQVVRGSVKSPVVGDDSRSSWHLVLELSTLKRPPGRGMAQSVGLGEAFYELTDFDRLVGGNGDGEALPVILSPLGGEGAFAEELCEQLREQGLECLVGC